MRESPFIAYWCFLVAALVAIILFSQGCTSHLHAIQSINKAAAKATAVAMLEWDKACKAKALGCHAKGNKTRETCPELVQCEKAQDAAYHAANGVHAAAAAVALAHQVGKPVDLKGAAIKIASMAANLYDLLRQAGYLEVFE